MKNMDFDTYYSPDHYTGNYLKDLFDAEGTKELVLKIASIDAEAFSDAKNPQWVLSFGAGIPKLRIKPAIGRALRQSLGPKSADWIGKCIALSVEPIEWEDSSTGEKKSGSTIKARSVGDGEAASLPTPPRNDSLDDDIPF